MQANVIANIRRIADEVCETYADGDFLNAVADLLEGSDLELTITEIVGRREPMPATCRVAGRSPTAAPPPSDDRTPNSGSGE